MSTEAGCQLDAAHPINLDTQLFHLPICFSWHCTTCSAVLCCLNLIHCSLYESWDLPLVCDCLNASIRHWQVNFGNLRASSAILSLKGTLAIGYQIQRPTEDTHDWTPRQAGLQFHGSIWCMPHCSVQEWIAIFIAYAGFFVLCICTLTMGNGRVALKWRS